LDDIIFNNDYCISEGDNMPDFDYKKAALTAWNVAKLISGTSWKYSYSDNALKKYDAETLAGFADEFSQSLGLGEHLPAAQGFDTYVSERINNAAKFTSVKVDGDKTLGDKLAVASNAPQALQDAAADVKTAIKGALELDEATKEAQIAFTKHVEDLTSSVADPDFTYDSSTLIHDLYRTREDAVTAIKEQQALELGKLEALFDDANPNGFRENMRQVLGLNAQEDEELDEQLKKIKSDMTAALEQKQTEEISAFEETVTGPITKAFDQAARRVSILASLDQNKQNEEIIKAILSQKEGELATRTGSANQEKSAKYKGAKLEDIKEFFTATGTKVTKSGDSFTISFPNRILNPLYYLDPSHNRKADMMQTPMLLKAMGYDTVNIRVSHPNKEYEKILAREAYEACREAGFEPKDIKVHVGGELYSEENPGDIKRKLFSDCPSQYDACELQAQKNAEVWKDVVNKAGAETTDSLRQRMAAGRAAHETPEPAIDPAPAVPGGIAAP